MSKLRKWRYNDGEITFNQGLDCLDCGLEYGSDAWCDIVIPDDVWELISPTGHVGSGILCFNCMARRLKFIGLENVPFHIGSGVYANGDIPSWK